MSIEAMAIALHHSRAKGAVKIVLIGIANHDGDGGAWPSIKTLSKYAGINPRNVKNALNELEKLGEVRRELNAGGTFTTADHMRPNLYHFLLACPPRCDRSKHHRMPNEALPLELSTGVSPATPGVASDTGGVSPVTPEPSLNRPTHEIEDSSSSNRARSADTYEKAVARNCARSRTGRHDYRYGEHCGWCGQRIDDHAAGLVS